MENINKHIFAVILAFVGVKVKIWPGDPSLANCRTRTNHPPPAAIWRISA